MKSKISIVIAAIVFAASPLFYACQHHNNNEKQLSNAIENHKGHVHEAEETEHDHEAEKTEHDHGSRTYTIMQNGFELFIEMQNLIVRENTDFTIFITRLADYKAIAAAEITVTLIGEKKYTTKALKQAKGNFLAKLLPKQTGTYNLQIDFIDNKNPQQLVLDSLMVYLNHDQVPSAEEEQAGLISYLKEKAWSDNFSIYEVKPQFFSSVIKTSGEILPAPGDETIITALHSGTISLANLLIEGKKVGKGDVIGIISSDLIHQNLTNDYLESKNKFEKANLDYQRAQKLIQEKLISEKEYLEAKLNFESTKNAFQNISKFYSDGNENVKASIDGFIRSVFVSEGQFIVEGQPIATIIQNKKVVLKANVPQQYNYLAPEIYTANFSPVYTDKLFNTNNLNGKRISFSSALPANSLFTSISFELDASPEIMPGSYCEVYLKSASSKKALIVPVSSLMEDQGNYFVFRMISGESYKKTYITVGKSDGEFIEITGGIEPGALVVNKGKYKVYLASLGSSAPAHAHAH